jgi:hypothetical protein
MSEHRNNIEETEEGLDMAEIILLFKKVIYNYISNRRS